jgi:hypothetical protein
MRFTIHPFRCFPMQCAVAYNPGSFQGQGTVTYPGSIDS